MGNIRVITSKERALEVAERYESQHTKAGKLSAKHEQFYQQLVELEDKSIESVNSFIGNTSWTIIYCGCCEAEIDCAVQLTVEDADTIDFNICLSCLKIANEQIGWTLRTFERERELNAVNILDIIDEFEAINIKDVIQRGDEIRTIHHTALTIKTRAKLISFMRDDELIGIDRNEYVMGGWRKID